MAPPNSVLLVEDDAEEREAFAELLHLRGYAVVEAENGKDALAKLSADPPPAAVLLDMGLPVMSGNELLSAMRQSDRLSRIPVVILSAGTRLMDPKDLARYASTFGVKAMLPKPIDPGRLLEVLSRAVAPEDDAASP